MKKKQRLLRRGCSIFAIFLLASSCRNPLDSSPREPKNEVPVTYNLGWWSYQDDLKINDFTVNILEDMLNLFNSKSLIEYNISGIITHEKGWMPEIKNVFISESLNKDTLDRSYDRIIEIMPVVSVINNKNTDPGQRSFSIKNEYIIESNKWGSNKIKIICLDKEQIIDLIQIK